jgi:hypothetical protein
MKMLKKSQAKGSLGDYASALGGEPLVVTEHGKPISLMVEAEGADLETLAVSTNPVFLAIMERSKRRLREEGGYTTEEVRRKLGLRPPARRRAKKRR